jgi:RNA polymerase sigma-70 factor (ECF subfamily)
VTTDLALASAETAIPLLLREKGSHVYRMGLSLCGSPQAAEDLVQETFLLAFRHWKQFEGRSKAATWLYSIAVRACRRRNRLRSGEPRHLESLSELLPSGEPRVPDIVSPEEGPLDAQLRREAREAVEHAIADLPRAFRIPLVLKDLAELKVSEVAGILGLKEATVKTRVHRARLRLRKQLAECLPRREASAPSHSRQICLDLLTSKQEALDRGAVFPVSERELCSRCASLFATLDLSRDLCLDIGRSDLPAELSQQLSKQLKSEGQVTRPLAPAPPFQQGGGDAFD